MFQFYHRNSRENVVSLFLSQNVIELPVKAIKGSLQDTHLSVFRCTLAQIRRGRGEGSAKQRILKLTQHILQSAESADELRLVEMICEIIQTGVAMQQPAAEIAIVLREIFRLIEENEFSVEV